MNKSFIELLRTPKIFDMALFDWFSVLLFIYFLNNFLENTEFIKKSNINRNKLDFLLLSFMIILGLYIHKKFNIDTKFGYYLGLNKDVLRN